MNQLSHPQWIAPRNFVQRYLRSTERVVAPPQFKHEFPNLQTYKFTAEITLSQAEWVLIHKGQLNHIDAAFLKQVLSTLTPVFANEVFVVLTSRSDIPDTADSVHLQSFLQQVDPQSTQQKTTLSLSQRLVHRIKLFTQQFADPRLDGVSLQLNAVLDRLSQLERTTQKLSQNNHQAKVRNINVMANLSLEELRSICRNGCQTAYLGNHTILCRILGNYLLYGDTRDIGIVPHLCFNGFWEPRVTLTMIRTVKPGWYCLDIGANHGYYSVVMSSIVGAAGRVLALEPNQRLAELVRRTLELNGFNDRALTLAKAVSDQPGQIVQLVVPQGNTGHASIRDHASATDEIMEVETVSVDQLTAEWPQVDFIKIDVEGAEEAVWQGMRETIRRNKDIVIVLEFGPTRYVNPKAFLEAILAEGFILRYIDYDTQPKEISIDRCLSERQSDYWDLFLSRS
jgi:FkbM family methyltransferase